MKTNLAFMLLKLGCRYSHSKAPSPSDFIILQQIYQLIQIGIPVGFQCYHYLPINNR